MASTLHLTISGKESSQRLQKTLADGHSVVIGRATKKGWEIPWDNMISREHATLKWLNNRLYVHCLEQARNPVHYRGKAAREASISRDEWFQIGHTTFHASYVVEDSLPKRRLKSQLVEFMDEEGEAADERAFSADELRQAKFSNAERQMEILERLPEKISTSQSDDDLGSMLSQLLLDAIPTALAVAVAHFDESELPNDLSQTDAFPKALLMRVQTRDDFTGRFQPSRRLIMKSLQSQKCAMHIFETGGEAQFTVSEGLGWAFCSPIKSESSRGWCMYVSGRGTKQGGVLVREEDLLGDLRFTRLVAQFIGSIRQVRMLQEQKTQLSSFFSPKIIENLTTANSQQILSPAERDISVLFCDVRGFSKKAEELGNDMMTLLKSVSAALSVMAGGIVERDGAVADFQGDAALGFWGWPTESPEGPVPACRTALAIQRAFQQAIADRENLLFGFSIGMGIAHGRAVAGQIGTNQQSKVGVFGQVVNQGSRLEGLTKQFNVPICMDEKSAEFAMRFLPPTEGRVRRLANVRPKGMDAPVTVYGLLPPVDDCPHLSPEVLADYEAAVEAVTRGEWSQALELLGRVPDSDGPKQFLIRQMAAVDNVPPANWDGAFVLQEK